MFQVEHYESGSVIIEQGTLGSSAYFIRTGAVEVVRGRDQEGEEVVLAKLGLAIISARWLYCPINREMPRFGP